MNVWKIILIFFTVEFLPFLSFAADDFTQRINDRIEELKIVKEQIRKNQKEVEGLQGQQKTLKNEIKKLDTGIKQVNYGIKVSRLTIEKLNLEINQIAANISETEREIKNKKETISKLLQVAQERDSESLLLALLRDRNLSNLALELQNIDVFNAKMIAITAGMKEIKNNLTDQLNLQNDKKQQKEREKIGLENKFNILADQKNGRANLLAQTKSRESLYQKQITELEKKQQLISDEIEKFEDELRRTADPGLLPFKRPGILGFPIANRKITQGYGATDFAQHAYSSKFHNGIDFGVLMGTEILAAEDGKVLALGNNERFQYGRYVLVKHGNNLTTLYAHLSNYGNISAGGMVKRGEVVGYSGNTGYSFGPHLHFTVYWSPSVRLENLSYCNCGFVPLGLTIDPMGYLP